MDPEFGRCLVEACYSFGLLLSSGQVGRMWSHFLLVREANERFNLTRITDVQRAAVEHYADSLTLTAWMASRGHRPSRALDVGTGGGWPAVPLAIALPDVSWTAIDSTGKKARFVAEAAAVLGLANLAVEQARANELARTVAPFDLVVCRAVGKLDEIIGECAGLVARGGFLVCYKTAHLGDDERQAGRRAAEKASLRPEPEFPVRLRGPDQVIDRMLVAYHAPNTRSQKASAKSRLK